MKTRFPHTPEAVSPSSDGLFDFGLIFWKGLSLHFQMLPKNWPMELEQKSFAAKELTLHFHAFSRFVTDLMSHGELFQNLSTMWWMLFVSSVALPNVTSNIDEQAHADLQPDN